jgi:hypothetical protein
MKDIDHTESGIDWLFVERQVGGQIVSFILYWAGWYLGDGQCQVV